MMKQYFSLFFLLLLVGCQRTESIVDPYEQHNRDVYRSNLKIDYYVVTPASKAYRHVIIPPFKVAILNVFNNFAEVPSVINAVLQGKFYGAYQSFLRVSVNTFFGLGGIFEMGNHLGIERKKYDFGQTLYCYGYKNSAFVMLPLFGPSTIRDGLGIVVDRIINPITMVNDLNGIFILNAIDLVSTKFAITEYLEQLPTPEYINDEYIFMRDTWLQYRTQLLEGQDRNWDDFYSEKS